MTVRILISNDDGYSAPGILALHKALSEKLGDRVALTVVAPEQDRSGASNSLTLDRPLKVKTASNGFIYVNGTPTDCVHIAVTGLLEHRPDLIVSGINSGANMGDDTIYSGTVAAAMEGFMCNVPAIAFSLTGKGEFNYDAAGHWAAEIVARFLQTPLSSQGHVLLNVNIPNLPLDQIKGAKATRLGKRHHAEPVMPAKTPHGETVYWIGPAGKAKDAGPGTDFHAVSEGFVSVTALQADLTRYESIEPLEHWLA